MSAPESLDAYPLRQALLPGAPGLPLFATRGPVDWLSRPERYQVVCEGRGGRIYAASEAALEEAQQLLRDAYGTQLVLRAPEVHTFTDPAGHGPFEPVMFLRIKSPRDRCVGLLRELAKRRVRVIEQDVRRDDLVLRAEVRLADALGLGAAAARLTNGTAAVWIWLSRYEAEWPPPAGSAP
ncbi:MULTISPECIES: hypothetical protein [unclassified Variovorax]|uniref:hypothetical protein n=1 Tax=unclassified Variovorax TaxID=663243 RepID=UPI002576B0F2|nr:MULTISPECIES: hypothetical protein [unclassified Variovorax]MDM0091129.1 hypothetical protein [Variovorax sp. J22G40]MDM0148869.1 hypothetical protein [Variovorax sp. J2P1-31]